MSYYRPRLPDWLWMLLAAFALILLSYYAVREGVRAIRADERATVYREANQWAAVGLSWQRAAWAKERDSLRLAVARVDTVLRTRLTIVQDTTWLPADTTPAVRLTACRAVLDTVASVCAQFRAQATAALEVADSLLRADSVRIVGLGFVASAARDSLNVAQVAVAKRPTWRAVVGWSVSSLAAGMVLARVTNK